VRVYDRALDAGEIGAGMGPLPYATTTGVYGAEAGEAVLAGMVNPGGEETRYRFELWPDVFLYGASAPESPRIQRRKS